MDIIWNKDEKEINMYNGHYVIATLSYLDNKASENELLKHILSTTAEPHNLVEQELRRILNNGVRNGFIIKIGNEYLLPTVQDDYQLDSDARIKEECEDVEIKEELEDIDEECEEQKYEYLNIIEQLMTVDCILFRNKLLTKILDVVEEQIKNKEPKNVNALARDIFEVTKVPDELVDSCTKDNIKEFYSRAYALAKTHKVCMELIRYTHLSLDKALIIKDITTFKPAKQNALKKYVEAVDNLEKDNCDKFRTIYICYLLNEVAEMMKNIQDKNAGLNCVLENFVQQAFALHKLGSSCSPSEVYFKFLSDLIAKTSKAKTKASKAKSKASKGKGKATKKGTKRKFEGKGTAVASKLIKKEN